MRSSRGGEGNEATLTHRDVLYMDAYGYGRASNAGEPVRRNTDRAGHRWGLNRRQPDGGQPKCDPAVDHRAGRIFGLACTPRWRGHLRAGWNVEPLRRLVREDRLRGESRCGGTARQHISGEERNEWAVTAHGRVL